MSTTQETVAAMPVAEYDRKWPKWSDFIKYNPGARHRRRMMAGMLQKLRFKSFLDVGCGNAEMLATVAKKFPGCKLAGVDLSSEVIRRNQQALPDVTFQVLNLDKEELSDKIKEQYDVVLCSEVIEHLEDRRHAFKNLTAVVKPGGSLIITCPTGPVYPTERKMGHTTHPDVGEIYAHADACGLEVQEVLNWGYPFYVATKWATNVNPDWAYEKFADGEYNLPKKAVSLGLYALNYLNSPNSEKGCQLVVSLRKRP